MLEGFSNSVDRKNEFRCWTNDFETSCQLIQQRQDNKMDQILRNQNDINSALEAFRQALSNTT